VVPKSKYLIPIWPCVPITEKSISASITILAISRGALPDPMFLFKRFQN